MPREPRCRSRRADACDAVFPKRRHLGSNFRTAPSTDARRRVVIVGAGFAGFCCARWLDRNLVVSTEVVLVNPGDHMVYSALLPDVAGGVVDPGAIATRLAASLPPTTVVVGRLPRRAAWPTGAGSPAAASIRACDSPARGSPTFFTTAKRGLSSPARWRLGATTVSSEA